MQRRRFVDCPPLLWLCVCGEATPPPLSLSRTYARSLTDVQVKRYHANSPRAGVAANLSWLATGLSNLKINKEMSWSPNWPTQQREQRQTHTQLSQWDKKAPDWFDWSKVGRLERSSVIAFCSVLQWSREHFQLNVQLFLKFKCLTATSALGSAHFI